MTSNHNPSYLDILGAQPGNLYDLEISLTYTAKWLGASSLENDLTISKGTFVPFSVGDTLNVSGAVDVSGTLGQATDTGSRWFGSLTINPGGTYTATSGTTTVSGNFDNDGTFTHNDGAVWIDADAAGAAVNIYPNNATFYTLNRTGNSYHSYIKENATVLFEIGGTGAYRWWNDETLIIGNSTTVGKNTNIPIRSNNANSLIQGASKLYPAQIQATYDDNFRYNSGHLKWVDFQTAVSTFGAGKTITLDGGCSFQNFTVSAGDRLNITTAANASFSGNLIYIGNFTLDGNITRLGGEFNVTEDLVVGGWLDASSSTAGTLGSLTINSGGIYNATSGTTTITSHTSNYALNNDGTFSHNNGAINLTSSGGSFAYLDSEQPLYDLNVLTSGEAVYINNPVFHVENDL